MNRRQAIVSVAGAGLVLATRQALGGPDKRRPAEQGPVRPKPLPFKAASLAGLSGRLLESHHQKNYSGAVRKLNAVRTELAGLGPKTPGFVLGALKTKELVFRNSVTLHELYFENLGGKGGPPKAVRPFLEAAFGSIGAFETTLKQTALTQAGGSGWTLLSLDLATGGLALDVASDHSQGRACSIAVLALDMYEHSYAIDYGADAKQYVEAFYKNIQWESVHGRLEKALKAYAAMS